jgi:3-hydroxybutyryl-CoA dehydrogenase
VTVLARDAQHPRRIAGLHFFEPVPLMRIVEVIPGLRTAPAVVSALTALMRRIGHQAVVVKDFPGFVVNHIGRAVLTEGLRIVSEQIAPVGVIDRIVRHSLGLRMGPFELLDLIGLDVSQPVTEQIYQDFQHEPRLRPTPLLLLQVAAGLLGRKTRQGFYRHSADGLDVPDTPAIAAASLPPGISLPPLWIDRSDAVLHGRIRDHVSSTGTVFDDGDVAHAASLCVIAPVGEDATTAALRLGLDPSRTVAVDALSGLAPQATLMAAPTFEPALRQAALAIFARAGQVDWIEDSPGFVAQRTLAMIVNTACDVAQQGMARPADIDTAIQLALGYPSGPLALGDQAGAARVLQILDAMHRFYGDARYRASPWLRRRAALGVPLGTLSDTALPIAQAA